MRKTSSVKQVQKKVDALDLSSVKFRLVQDQNWTEAQADRVEPYYKGYLTLTAANPKHPLVPTREVDQMWHAHILDTRKYAADCQNSVGHFVHHVPAREASSPADEASAAVAFAQTKALFRKVIGFEFAPTANENGQTVCMPAGSDQSPPAAAWNKAAICQGGNDDGWAGKPAGARSAAICQGGNDDGWAGKPAVTQGRAAICQGGNDDGWAGGPAATVAVRPRVPAKAAVLRQ